jgi:hypothetical protein
VCAEATRDAEMRAALVSRDPARALAAVQEGKIRD